MIPGATWAEGCIYYIGSPESGRLKIGYTKGNPGKRLRALQTGSPSKLYLMAVHPGTPELERRLHQQFSDARLHGEWFDASDDLLVHLAEVCALTIALNESMGEVPPEWAKIGLSALIRMAEPDAEPTLQ